MDIFNQVRNHATSEQMKFPAALLLAVEDTIKESGLECSPVAYFASLMTFLTDAQHELNDVVSVTYLLSIVFPHIPDAILRQKFSETHAVLTAQLNLFSSEATVVRPLLTCVSHLIAAQQIPTWSSAELNAIYQALLFRLIDERPKVRKVSQAGVMLILGKSAELTLKSPPSCSILLRFITHLLKDAQKSSIKDSEWSSVLHLLGFLKENLHQIVISAKNGKALEPLLSQLLTIPLHKNTHATILAFDAISTFFQQACIPQTLDLPISFEKVNKWIIDICSMKPNINNFDLLPIFFDALVNACVYFGKLVVENQGNESYLISQSCFKTQLKLTFDTLFDMWQSTIHSKDHVKKTHDFIGNSLTKLVTGTISLEMIKETLLPYSVEWKRSEDLASEHPETEFELVINRISKERTVVEHIAHQISGPGLSLTFQAAWGSLLSFSCHFFTHIHNIHVKHIHDSSAPLIQPSEPFVNVFISPVVVLASEMIHRLCDDQIFMGNSHFSAPKELKNLIGCFLSTMGPRIFLSMMPMNLGQSHSSNDSKYSMEEDEGTETKKLSRSQKKKKNRTERTWLLPIIKTSVSNSELKYFIDVLAPISVRIAQLGKDLVERGKLVQGKMCAVVWRQIWDCLVAFCDCPVDLAEEFERVCQILVPMLTGNDDRVPSICEAFIKFVSQLQYFLDPSTKSLITLTNKQLSQNLAFLAGYAVHLFPPFFAKYVDLEISIQMNQTVKEKEGDDNDMSLKSNVERAIQTWMSISETKIVVRFLNTTAKKYLDTFKIEVDEADESSKLELHAKQCAYLSLIRLMVSNSPSILKDKELIALLSKTLAGNMGIQNLDVTIQKRAYKILTVIFDPYRKKEMIDIDDILKSLTQSMSRAEEHVVPSAKRDRLSLISHIIVSISYPEKRMEPKEEIEFSQWMGMAFPGFLSEVILATKEVNEKTRCIAYEVVVEMGRKICELEVTSNGKAWLDPSATSLDANEFDSSSRFFININEFAKMIMAGLAGQTPHMISATIHCLSRLIYEFGPLPTNSIDENENEALKLLSKEVIEGIVQSVLLYAMESKNREIIKAALSFVKVIMTSCPYLLQTNENEMDTGYDYLERSVLALLKWSSEHQSHFKVACRYILERLIRKYGLERVGNYFPSEHEKLLINLKKRHERTIRKRVEARANKPEESENISKSSTKKAFNEVVNEDDESDDDIEDEEELPEIFRELFLSSNISNNGSRNQNLDGDIRIREMQNDDSDEDPIDFLDKRALAKMVPSSIVSKKSKTTKDESDYKKSSDGRYIVEESEDEQLAQDPNAIMQAAIRRQVKQVNEDYRETKVGEAAFKVSADGKRIRFDNKTHRFDKKRSLGSDDEGEESVKSNNQKKAKLDRNRNYKKKQISQSELKKAGIKDSGAVYKSSKAKGDIKREGKPDPFAYIPLNPKIVGSKKGRKKDVKLNSKASVMDTDKRIYDIERNLSTEDTSDDEMAAEELLNSAINILGTKRTDNLKKLQVKGAMKQTEPGLRMCSEWDNIPGWANGICESEKANILNVDSEMESIHYAYLNRNTKHSDISPRTPVLETPKLNLNKDVSKSKHHSTVDNKNRDFQKIDQCVKNIIKAKPKAKPIIKSTPPRPKTKNVSIHSRQVVTISSYADQFLNDSKRPIDHLKLPNIYAPDFTSESPIIQMPQYEEKLEQFKSQYKEKPEEPCKYRSNNNGINCFNNSQQLHVRTKVPSESNSSLDDEFNLTLIQRELESSYSIPHIPIETLPSGRPETLYNATIEHNTPHPTLSKIPIRSKSKHHFRTSEPAIYPYPATCGHLGPDLDNQEYMERMKKWMKQREYSAQLRQDSISKNQIKTTPAPRRKSEFDVLKEIAMQKREKMRIYSAQVQKPTIKPILPPVAREEECDKPLTNLEVLDKKYKETYDMVANIRKELGLTS